MSITLDTYPNKWAPHKPKQTITEAQFEALLKRNALLTKKYDGNRCHILIGSEGKVQCFSIAGTINWTGCLPNLRKYINSLNLPEHTFLDGELYVPNQETTEAIQLVINSGSDVKGAKAEAELNPNFAVFDILVYGGQEVYKLPYKDRIALLPTIPEPSRLHKAKSYNVKTMKEAEAIIETEDLEGMVIADSIAPHNLNFNGNVNRGQSFKLKQRYPEDFLVTKFSTAVNTATGEDLGVGTLTIHSKNEDGTFTPNGTVGSFKDTFDRIKATTLTYPIVVEILHFGKDSRNNLMFPQVLRHRPDLEIEWKVKEPPAPTNEDLHPQR